MKRAFIVEADQSLTDELIMLIQKRKDIIITGIGTSVKTSVEQIQSLTPDIVLMDIELSDGTSFDILKALPELSFKVIFITAYDCYAIKAIKVGALDYILKPVNEAELNTAIDKFLTETEPTGGRKQTFPVSETSRKENPLVERIVLRTLYETFFVPLQEIEYCQAEGAYTSFYISSGTPITTSKSLKEYEDILPEAYFIRPHKSFIVNTTAIRSYNNDGLLTLRSGMQIPLSHRRKESILKMLFIQ